MKRLDFKLTLLTDVVISAQTATEGRNQSLSFIPGSNFMGILASAIYKEENNKLNYDIFHSGKVRFGDAHILHSNTRSFQVPFSWFHPKGGKLTENVTYMADFISQEQHRELTDRGIVLQQARNGYFTPEGYFLSPEKMFAQKTEYDPDKRRPKEGAMYGYEALSEGSEWQFTVEIDEELIDNCDIELIQKEFKGIKPLGRSKTAEYGRVDVEPVDVVENNTPQEIKPKVINLESKTSNVVLVYADSRLAFRDKVTGQPTFTPAAVDLGLPNEANVLWEYSQIRTGVYAPWNGKRKSRDEDRVFIEKGSVFTVDVTKISEKLTTEKTSKGVGLYRTEGFGKLIVNPDFLDFEPGTGKIKLLLKSPDPVKPAEVPGIPNSLLINWLSQQKSFYTLLKQVDDFIKAHGNKFNKVTRSQWGNVRSRAKTSETKAGLLDVLFRKPVDDMEGGDLYHGESAKQWITGREILEKEITDMEAPDKTIKQFLEKLAARMQKEGGAR